jgi:type VI protein secretion system component VasF
MSSRRAPAPARLSPLSGGRRAVRPRVSAGWVVAGALAGAAVLLGVLAWLL